MLSRKHSPHPRETPQPPTFEKPVLLKQEPVRPRNWMEHLQPWLAIVQSIWATLALFAGYYWFLQQRSDKPNIKLDQSVTQRAADGQKDMWLITLNVQATNIGKVKVELDSGKVKIMQINPVVAHNAPSKSFDLKQITLEPGESDQAIFTTLLMPASVRTLQVSTNYAVPKTHNYWTLVSAVDLGDKEQKKTDASSVH